MKKQDIKRLETILKYYERICVEFEKIEDSMMTEDTEMFNSCHSMSDIVRDFSRTASDECNQLAGKLHAIKEISNY